MRKKSVPIRTCIACRERKEKRELIRIVRSAIDKVEIDPTGKKSGRGAYLCRKEECISKLSKADLSRALKSNLSESDYSVLKGSLLELLTSTQKEVDHGENKDI
ncbi:MAG: uncharacterized protein PWP04_100 [Candidatus Atribacteria bacterium]|nr:uncharacterized protein [Candidatus Atribacteria bacterium]